MSANIQTMTPEGLIEFLQSKWVVRRQIKFACEELGVDYHEDDKAESLVAKIKWALTSGAKIDFTKEMLMAQALPPKQTRIPILAWVLGVPALLGLFAFLVWFLFLMTIPASVPPGYVTPITFAGLQTQTAAAPQAAPASQVPPTKEPTVPPTTRANTSASPVPAYSVEIPSWAQPTTYSDSALQNQLVPLDKAIRLVYVFKEEELAGDVALKIDPEKNIWVSAKYVCRPMDRLKAGQSNPNGCFATLVPSPTPTRVPLSLGQEITEQDGTRIVEIKGDIKKGAKYRLVMVRKDPINLTKELEVELVKETEVNASAATIFVFDWPKTVPQTSEAYSLRVYEDGWVIFYGQLYLKPAPPTSTSTK